MLTIESTTNRFAGVLADPEGLPVDPQEFAERLDFSLDSWRREGLQMVWLEVPIARSELIPIAVDANFTFHHSGEDYLMLTLPLQEGAFIPAHATHYIGAGGVVLTEERELLVVSEKQYRTPGQPPRFKLPGGALHQSEHLVDGVIREIREETGVETAFDALVCFRHWHGYRYGKSDIYFISRLHPLSRKITIQEEEIAECRWMPVEDYLGDEHVSRFNKRIVHAALDSPGLIPVELEGYGDREQYEIFMPPGGERESS